MSTRPWGLSVEDHLRFHGWTVTDTGCWEWNGGRHPQGYGQLKRAGKTRFVHRVAYEAWVGPIPEGMHLLHSCDNPPCINPEHLRPGTVKENMADRDARGRGIAPKGESNGAHVLTEADVLQIRRDRGTLGTLALAQRYGVSKTTIKKIVNRQSWRHI